MDGLSADINGLGHRLTRHAQARDDDRAGRHRSRHRRRDAAIDRAGDESRQRAPLVIAAIALAAVRPCAASARAAGPCAAGAPTGAASGTGSTIATTRGTASSAITAASSPTAITATGVTPASSPTAITTTGAPAAITATAISAAATIPAAVPTPIATSSATAFGEGVIRSEVGSSGRQGDQQREGRSRCQEHTGDGHRRASCDGVRFAKANNMLRR
jgi:hypothetical protein